MNLSAHFTILVVLLLLVYLFVQKQKREQCKLIFPLVNSEMLSFQDRIFVDQLLNQKIQVLKEIYYDLCNKYNRGIYPIIQEVPCDLENRLGILKSNMELIQSIKTKIIARCALSDLELVALNQLLDENFALQDLIFSKSDVK